MSGTPIHKKTLSTKREKAHKAYKRNTNPRRSGQKWKSGSYAERLVTAMRNSSHVITAWYGDNLIGLVRSLDDGEAVAFIHYLLVRPEYQKHHIGGSLLTKLLAYYESYLYVKMMPSDKALIPFYEKYGFRIYDNYTAMEIDRL